MSTARITITRETPEDEDGGGCEEYDVEVEVDVDPYDGTVEPLAGDDEGNAYALTEGEKREALAALGDVENSREWDRMQDRLDRGHY